MGQTGGQPNSDIFPCEVSECSLAYYNSVTGLNSSQYSQRTWSHWEWEFWFHEWWPNEAYSQEKMFKNLMGRCPLQGHYSKHIDFDPRAFNETYF